jgi:hypothetical protein
MPYLQYSIDLLGGSVEIARKPRDDVRRSAVALEQ